MIKSKKGSVKFIALILFSIVAFIVIIFLGAFSGSAILRNGDGLSMETLEQCLESCRELRENLPSEETEEYFAIENEANELTETCLRINEEGNFMMNREKILASCKLSLDCVRSGETIYLEKEESCEAGISECCSGKGVCAKGLITVPDYVSCVSY